MEEESKRYENDTAIYIVNQPDLNKLERTIHGLRHHLGFISLKQRSPNKVCGLDLA